MFKTTDFKLIITCEHAGNVIPAFARKLNIPKETLETHRGYDIGAYEIYKQLIKKFKPNYHSAGKFSRLFIDLNRSLWNKNVFSEFWDNAKPKNGSLKKLAHDSAKYFVLRKKAFAYYFEYRAPIERFVEQILHQDEANSRTEKGSPTVVHLAIHSFTPVLNSKERDADIGILYDPSRPTEQSYANIIINTIKTEYPQYKVRRNYPYQGKTDGLCTELRKKFDPKRTGQYIGFEIEINQKLLQNLR